MATAKQTFSDFSAGLITSIDEALLPPSASPDLTNVELLQSGAIKRRKGWASIAEDVSATRIVAVHRHYKNSGDRRWCAVAATQLLYDDAALDAQVNIEASYYITSATYAEVTWAYADRGTYVAVGATPVTFTTASCDGFTVNMMGTSASISIDGGAYSSVTGLSHVVTSLAATPHTVTFKQPSPSAIKLSSTAATVNGYSAIYRSLGYSGTAVSFRFSIAFYDDGGTQTLGEIGITTSDGSPSSPSLRFSPASTAYQRNGVDTSVSRSVGWHTLEFINNGMYLDGVFIGNGTALVTQYTGIYAAVTDYTAYAVRDIWIDTLVVEGKTLDECGSTGTWSAVTAINYNAPRTVAVDTSTYYSGFRPCGVDSFVVGSSSAWSVADNTISASTSTFGFASFGDAVYYNSPYDALKKLAASSATPTTVATAPMGGFLVEHKRRLYTCGRNDDTSLLEFCALDDPDDWTSTGTDASAGSIRIFGKDTGHDSTGLAVWNNAIYQFTKRGVGFYSGDAVASNAVAKVISDRFGCVAPKSLAVAPNAMVWLGADAVYTYGLLSGVDSTEGAGFGVISTQIEDIIQSMTDSAKEAAVGAVYGGRYWLACDPNGTGENDTVFVHRFATSSLPPAWTRYEYAGLDISCMYVTRGDEYALYAGTAGGDFVRLDYTDSDGSAAIAMSYTMPPIAPKGYQGLRHYRTAYLLADAENTQNVTFTAVTDDVYQPAAVVDVDDENSKNPIRIPVSARGRSLQVTISSSGAEQPLAVSGLTLFYDEQRTNR